MQITEQIYYYIVLMYTMSVSYTHLLREAALAEPLSCCLHGMDLLDVKLGDVVVVIGMGMIGSMMVKLCSIAGASHIIVIETQENKRESAKDYGATLFINPNVENVETVIAQNGIQNVDKVMECVGAKVTMRTAFEMCIRDRIHSDWKREWTRFNLDEARVVSAVIRGRGVPTVLITLAEKGVIMNLSLIHI